MTKLKATEKTIVYTIQFRVDAKDAVDMNYLLDQLRETGEAEITDVEIETKKEN